MQRRAGAWCGCRRDGDAPLLLLAWFGLIALQLALPFGAEFILWRALSRRA